jgi:hypothetical protein
MAKEPQRMIKAKGDVHVARWQNPFPERGERRTFSCWICGPYDFHERTQFRTRLPFTTMCNIIVPTGINGAGRRNIATHIGTGK